ncbi:uncharacterized protein LOC106074419 [Biomphalaria glabrata]|uniref:Uncharacterized protein LOC106074419 n=1 Tax=Biomphalaria glabrata TaxID=6526 RepID=A0A9U8EKE4_BIOGL|nr:uncharacterized protein LOC106074419 [Biomphalaria glabrata]XP_013090646.2 uncharacterized protein LOC106074419 [Biomphalaria glabrata]
MASFRIVREKIVRRTLAQLVKLREDADNETHDTSSEEIKVNGFEDPSNDAFETRESLAVDSLGLQDASSLSTVKLKKQSRHFEFIKATKPMRSFSYWKQIHKVTGLLNTGQVVAETLYVPELDSCFRYGIYFPKQETSNCYCMEIFIDMCQTGKEVTLPVFLQTSTKIFIINQSKQSEEIFASEEGIFNLTRNREFGWFEVASVSTNWLEMIKNKICLLENDNLTVRLAVNVYDSLASNRPTELEENDSSESDSSETDEEDEESTEDMLLLDSFLCPVSELDLSVSDGLLFESEEWHLEFLGHSVKAIFILGCDEKLDIFLDFFLGSPTTLPDIAIFKCRVSIVHPEDKKKTTVVGENDLLFDMLNNATAIWHNNHVTTVDIDQIDKTCFVADNKVLFRFDFTLLD